MARKVHEPQVIDICAKLCDLILKGNADLRDIYSIGLKTLITDVPKNMGEAVADCLVKRLMTGISMSEGVQMERLDILTDLTTEDGNAEDLVALVDAEYPLEVAMVVAGGLKGTSIGEIAAAELDRVNAMLGKGPSEQGEEEQ